MPAIQVLNDYPAVALVAALFFGTFVSEDAACLAAGAAAAEGRIGLAASIAACFLGIFAGDLLLYVAGRALGNRVFDNRIVRRLVSDNARSKASAWLDSNAASAVLLSRFVTGLRLPTYLAAGALRTDLKKFTIYFPLASAIWTPTIVSLAAASQTALFGGNAVVGIFLGFLAVRFVLKYSSGKNRRLAIGRIKRIMRWEFWPVQVFYIPVVLYVLCLAIRHRSLTVFTAVNPALPAGGFKGESKSAIYDAIGSSPLNRQSVLKYTRFERSVPLTQRLEQAWRFIDENGLHFPLVVKPDAGERGKGVLIVRSFDELADALSEMKHDTLLQEFAAGVEVSIFYCRLPANCHGHIFSMTEKRFPTAIGDGISTVEELILNDDRAVCLAQKYFEQLGDRVSEVPARGAEIKLIDIGTHSRGAIFCEGEWLRTAELETSVDDICRRFPGFYFGRFDLRAASFAELQRGRFKIIELNGVTSESTNIYDPQYSLVDAYRILFRQWRLAFDIGAANVKLGARATGICELARLAVGLEPKRVDDSFDATPVADCA